MKLPCDAFIYYKIKNIRDVVSTCLLRKLVYFDSFDAIDRLSSTVYYFYLYEFLNMNV